MWILGQQFKPICDIPRIFDSARVIQMNMEIAILFAHVCMLPPDMYQYEEECR